MTEEKKISLINKLLEECSKKRLNASQLVSLLYVCERNYLKEHGERISDTKYMRDGENVVATEINGLVETTEVLNQIEKDDKILFEKGTISLEKDAPQNKLSEEEIDSIVETIDKIEQGVGLDNIEYTINDKWFEEAEQLEPILQKGKGEKAVYTLATGISLVMCVSISFIGIFGTGGKILVVTLGFIEIARDVLSKEKAHEFYSSPITAGIMKGSAGGFAILFCYFAVLVALLLLS